MFFDVNSLLRKARNFVVFHQSRAATRRELKISVILSGALRAESNLEGVHREAWRHLLPSRDLVGSPPKPSGDTPRECENGEKAPPLRIRTPTTAGELYRRFHGIPARSRFAARGKTLRRAQRADFDCSASLRAQDDTDLWLCVPAPLRSALRMTQIFGFACLLRFAPRGGITQTPTFTQGGLTHGFWEKAVGQRSGYTKSRAEARSALSFGKLPRISQPRGERPHSYPECRCFHPPHTS